MTLPAQDEHTPLRNQAGGAEDSLTMECLEDGRVLVTVSTVLEPWAARRMGRNLQLLADAAEVSEPPLVESEISPEQRQGEAA